MDGSMGGLSNVIWRNFEVNFEVNIFASTMQV